MHEGLARASHDDAVAVNLDVAGGGQAQGAGARWCAWSKLDGVGRDTWAGAAYVRPSMRRNGIGRELLLALEPEALSFGYNKIYCATSTSASLLDRCGWRLMEKVDHEGELVGVYSKRIGE